MNLVKNIKMNTVDPVFDFPYIIQLEMTLHVLSSVYKDNLSLLIYILATGIERYHKERYGLSISTSIFCSLFSNIFKYFFSVDNYSIQTVSSRPVEAITDIQ
ncbi:hypothetical protein PHYBLDRAFT_66048 [Phycomyces blakesleeanus NRRL 1555(-)]|uniref:Uncharacterized protein n=1 Tax=Phycomyces blakesleeanus (strain ATCC 8743b / DSM 1359 / FGSC 10004 / NBRC 33097 / NRRL 1555) TaxID=763407 RepID=A0A167L708_PHYB8|nr:hypothetical protein PHYBLDRAFT_66048 [Phycomyces blakesleeanus NRRL 1555(-)]OAD69737.1 hypothetical protein PHYBLDRAFT_66048 [Phycomyces blakesleeanus NRRL 1555(-)]|eukprot:XP_018287777.1 hypothetical protein PHYBLDRAFT_66048 [Phycomyces blakesleeanus NRRL 1555(-)]